MFAAVARSTVLRRSTLTSIRCVSSSAKSSSAILIGSASPSPSNTPATGQQQAAGLRTAAASAAPKLAGAVAASSPNPLAPGHAIKDGRVFSANRLYHAISSESAPGLSQAEQEPDYTRKMQRMRDAQELAGF